LLKVDPLICLTNTLNIANQILLNFDPLAPS
jgi:hypothetical protein